ncbi:MAG: HEPN domain-containing protein [Candidatus Thiodiazotropha endolucinida]|nr:hypothetical protein [Candidatus Thiodiazotropha taylori]
MGQLKESHLKQKQERAFRIAETLGLTYDELESTKYTIEENRSAEGHLYGYYLKFEIESDEEVLKKISGLRSDNVIYLAPQEVEPEKELEPEYEYEAIVQNTDYLSNFLYEIEDLKQLLKIGLNDPKLERILHRQIFVSIIGALETYLSDAFINEVITNKYRLQCFVENHPIFKKQKITVDAIYQEVDRIEASARKVMLETIYHKLPIVKQMYEKTFEIDFPDISVMQKYIEDRHDLVHRNGKTTDGEEVPVNEEVIKKLIRSATELVEQVSERIKYHDLIPF